MITPCVCILHQREYRMNLIGRVITFCSGPINNPLGFCEKGIQLS